MKSINETTIPDRRSMKPGSSRPKSREVSSRFLSPTTSTPSPNRYPSSVNPRSTATDARRHQINDATQFGSYSSSSSSSSNGNRRNSDSLADHLGNERLKNLLDCKMNDKSRFEKEAVKQNTKENRMPSNIGGSMRYTGRLSNFTGKSASPSPYSTPYSKPFSINNHDSNSGVLPGRLSVDENALYGKSNRRNFDLFVNDFESDSNYSDVCSSTDLDNSPTISRRDSNSSHSFRRYGKEVSSRYMQDFSSRVPTRLISDSDNQLPISSDLSSQKLKKFTVKSAIKRVNSLTSGYKSATSQWARSPGRSGSPPMTVESKQRPMSFSSLKPPTSTTRVKGMEKLLNLGLDLFRSKKRITPTGLPTPLRSRGDVETVHRMKMLHNRLIQWRFANARADAVHAKMTHQVERNLISASASLAKLQLSVLEEKLQLQKKKLKMKLDFILQCQIKSLETWSDMEMQHLSTVSMITEDLQSAICRVPLVEGAKVDPQSTLIALQQASDLTFSIASMLPSSSPSNEETVASISKLAEVVSQEKLIMEECLELLRDISILEIQESSLKSYMIQSEPLQHGQQQEEKQEKITA